jgi:hypothetical protein
MLANRNARSRVKVGQFGSLAAYPSKNEAVTKLKIEQFESQDVVLRLGLEHNL